MATHAKRDGAPLQDAAKTAKEAPPSPRNGNRLPLGAHPGNTGGKKGRSGRRPQKFSAFLKTLRDKPDVQQAIEDAASDPNSKGFAAVLRTMTEYDSEKPAQKQEIVGPLEVRVRMVRE